MKPEYKVMISGLLEDPEWDAFVAGTPGGHHVQTSRWARVKSILGWKVTRISITDGSQIVAGAQILIRSLPFVGRVGYVTKGPLCYQENPDPAEMVLHEIVQFSRRNRCLLMAVQPPNNGMCLNNLLESLNFCPSNLELAPTASLVIDLRPGPEKIMQQMKRETRKHIRQSERAGIIVREGGQSDLDIFYALYLKTSRRQGFMPYHREYFDILWQTMAPPGWIALFIAYYGNEAVSAQLLIPFADTVIAKMVGWSGGHSRHSPNDALFWACIVWAVQHGYGYFDFEGVDPMGARAILSGRKVSDTPVLSQDIVKYRYGGNVVFYPPVYVYFPNKILNWVCRRLPSMPHITGGNSIPYRFLEYLRKR